MDKWKKLLAGLVAIAAGIVYATHAHAAAPAVKVQAPGYYRMTLGDGPAMSAQLVASGIENMQVQYGVRTTTGPTPETRYYDASAVPATLWTSVTSVRLWLLARSTTPDPSNVSTAAYPMGDQTYPDRSTTPTDGFQRQLFTLVVQIRK